MIKLRQVPAEFFFRGMVMQSLGMKPYPIAKHQEDLGIQASCVNCVNFSEKGFTNPSNGMIVQPETCMKYKQHPPARVIALSCPSWQDADDIPFDFAPAIS